MTSLTSCHRHRIQSKPGSNNDDNSLAKELEIISDKQQQQSIQQAWHIFNGASSPQRLLILRGLLSSCCTSQLSYLWDNVQSLLRTDFTLVFPTEITLRIFTHLDAQTLCAAAQVNRRWQLLANDDSIWHRMCEQHIDKKCAKCGWGLPLLQKRKIIRVNNKRTLDDCEASAVTIKKPRKMERKPWKAVYSERLVVERHWRKNQAKVFTVKGAHSEAIMTVALCEAQGMVITGSKDKTIKVWSLAGQNAQLIRTLKGHTRAVHTLQMDDTKLVSGSMDHTLKIWNYHTGQCIRTLEGHTAGVTHLHFDSKLLASGSTDGMIKVWNFQNGECSTLSGHTQSVTHVRLYQQSTRLISSSDDGRMMLWDLESRQCLKILEGHHTSVQAAIPSMPGFLHRFYYQDVKKENDDQQTNQQEEDQHRSGSPVAISGSLDNTLKVWSLDTGACLRTLFGHNQGIHTLAYDKLRLVSGAKDGELKIWDIESGQVMHSLQAHEGSINSIVLSDTKIISVSDAGDFRVADFGV
ncbi:quinon protein alcohol dehydrogenase-like superfamily [Halteromyces radiatus]|uniref:quinon protein alcohol dehydrogenase-like superfamily n=1 Tax=Halteromyces radiatus TaxID=101107 RepID=UPI00221E857E|nr:quinon protein alcohol dehydrogenase-like superfamily [Halteromyces radiatus]KAI8088888.1 quinon protein alcohol dehydrogenase-like superfamily [Halteromyces radiatus]